MVEIEKIAQYGGAGIACLLIVAIVYLIIKLSPMFFIAMEKFHDAIDKNTKVTQQMYNFLKNLNGELKKSVKNKRDD